MSRILDLKTKRASAWEEAKKFLDAHEGNMTGEELETYEKMEADISNMGREIEALERAEAFEAKMKQPTSAPITGNPTTGPTDETSGRASEGYKKAFWNAMKSNAVSYDVTNALKVGQDVDGGYLVPDEFEQRIVDKLSEENIMRRIATVIQTSSGERKIPIVSMHGEAKWIDEESQITDGGDTFGQVTLGAHKLATTIKISEELLNDSVFDMETYIANEFARRIGEKEEIAFLVGDGSNRPLGIFHENGGAEIGITAQSTTAITFDEIYDLFYSLKSGYRNKGTWVMNDSTVKAIRKLKDSSGQYLWQPSAGAGTPDTLLNRPIMTSSFVPELVSGKTPIAFGDFSYYWIADRQGRIFKRLNEVFALTDQVGFKATQRVDGKLILSEAVKLLKMGS